MIFHIKVGGFPGQCTGCQTFLVCSVMNDIEVCKVYPTQIKNCYLNTDENFIEKRMELSVIKKIPCWFVLPEAEENTHV